MGKLTDAISKRVQHHYLVNEDEFTDKQKEKLQK